MGRVFLSPRMGVRAASERWRRAGRSLRDRDRAALDRLAALAMAGASQGFYAFDEPLEASLVPVLAGLAGAAPGGRDRGNLMPGAGTISTAGCGARSRPGE